MRTPGTWGAAWKDLDEIIRKHALGVRLFNVPAVLFNLLQNQPVAKQCSS